MGSCYGRHNKYAYKRLYMLLVLKFIDKDVTSHEFDRGLHVQQEPFTLPDHVLSTPLYF